MDIRRDVKSDLDALRALSETVHGREILRTLMDKKSEAMLMLKDEKLLSTVFEFEGFSTSMTLAHCLVFAGDNEVRVALAKMPARVLEQRTSANDKVVDLLIATESQEVKEALSENTEALKITIVGALSESGHVDILGMKVKVMDEERAKLASNTSVAHALLYDPSKKIMENISKAPKDILSLKNGEGKSVKEMLEEAKRSYREKIKSVN